MPVALAAMLLAACSGSTTAVEPAPAAATATAACEDAETTVFACRTGSGQDVAVCASQDASQLRYVETGKPSATWPGSGMADAGDFRSGTLMYSGGGGAWLRFDRNGDRHFVYTGIGRGWEKAGVVVQRDGETMRELACQGEVTSLIGPALFERASIPADDSGFEIP